MNGDRDTGKGNLVGGEWTGASTGRWCERRDPADPTVVVSRYPDSSPQDVHDAVTSVYEGYREWAQVTPEARAAVLERAAGVLERDAERLSREIVAEEGKTLAEASNETRRTPANLRFYAGEALRLAGRTYPTGEGSMVLTTREPVGVVAAITPWNFPLNIPSRKLGPALAAGNGVVFKPSEVTPLLGQRMVEALLEAGLPSGAIALVHGGGEAGAALVADERVSAVTFTGSTAVGKRIHRTVGVHQRCQLEMGGKNPVVVLEDADLDRAAGIITRGAFGLTGQACTGTSRVIVADAVHDALVDRVAERTRRLRVGNGLTAGVDMGPLATSAQYEKYREYRQLAITEGARLVTGDEPVGPEGGYFVRPSVVVDASPGSRLATEEVFGPLLTFLRADSFDEAVKLANSTSYGLAAGIVTSDLGRALSFAGRIESGIVKVNQATTGMAMNAPFGGVKNSSTQTFKEQAGDTMMSFYTVDKTVYVAS
jgi:acyl-CoA reductase-like NAD-dependent aldehyde dehydrogenase